MSLEEIYILSPPCLKHNYWYNNASTNHRIWSGYLGLTKINCSVHYERPTLNGPNLDTFEHADHLSADHINNWNSTNQFQYTTLRFHQSGESIFYLIHYIQTSENTFPLTPTSQWLKYTNSIVYFTILLNWNVAIGLCWI